jgi:hypothetical protein
MGSDHTYTLAMAERFPVELARMPRKVQNAYNRTVAPILKSFPEQSNPPKIKPLNSGI